MTDDDTTREQPGDASLPTNELDSATTAADGPLAYSDLTGSMPVVDYRPPQSRPLWLAALVMLAAIGMAAAAFVLGRSTAPQPATVASATPEEAAPVAPPVTVTVTQPAPPPAVTVAVPVQPTPTTSLPPLATPQARIAEPLICSLHNEYPQMQPVDLALSMLDRGIYRDYDEASLVVQLVLNDGCHGI